MEKRLVGVLGPTHGFTATWPVLKMAATIPDVRGVDAFALATRGGTRVAGKTLPGFEGTAAYLPAAILALRGARVRGVGAIDMPLNWTTVIPSQSPDNVEEIVSKGEAQVSCFVAPLLEGRRVYRGLPQLLLGILILPISIGYMLIARLLLAKTFFADERCISCGRCERECPQGAVYLRGKAKRPYWTYDCQNCMRCMSNCPTDAIQGGQAWLLFYAWLTTLSLGGLAISAAARSLGFTDDLPFAITLLGDYLWIIISVWVAYAVLWLGLFVPGLRFVISRATLTRFYRRYRGPGSGDWVS